MAVTVHKFGLLPRTVMPTPPLLLGCPDGGEQRDLMNLPIFTVSDLRRLECSSTCCVYHKSRDSYRFYWLFL